MHSFVALVSLLGASLCAALRPGDTPQVPLANSPASGEVVRAALKVASIIPDVLDDFEPTVFIAPFYPAKQKSIDLGNKVKPGAAQRPPNLYVYPTKTLNPNVTYTVVLSDPDATSHAEPVMAQMCHWIITNITVTQTSDSEDSILLPMADAEGNSRPDGVYELIPYLGPAPPPKTGYHRYVFALLASNENNGEPTKPKKPESREHWGYGKVGAGIREWAKENEMTVIAANFFISRNCKQ